MIGAIARDSCSAKGDLLRGLLQNRGFLKQGPTARLCGKTMLGQEIFAALAKRVEELQRSRHTFDLKQTKKVNSVPYPVRDCGPSRPAPLRNSVPNGIHSSTGTTGLNNAAVAPHF